MIKRFTEIAILILPAIAIILLFKVVDYKLKLEASQTPVAEETRIEYGIVVDTLVEYKDVVKANETFSEILSAYLVPSSIISELVKKSNTVFDVRKIKQGNPYTVLCLNDSAEKVLYFIYENSSRSYVVFDMRDSIHVDLVEKEVVKKIKTVSGTITGSLWNTLQENKTDPRLAIDLSEVYAWTIDFYGIQKGDQFKVVYEELSIEDEPVGLEKILAAWFYHAGKPYYAFYYSQDDVGEYFDENGSSLRKAFLKAPLRYSRISSRFSHSRLHPVLRIRRPHLGVDYAAPRGTPVQSIGDGVVLRADYAGGAGRIVKIKHNANYTTSYMHLSGFAKGIRKGKRVKQGEIIGYVGSTGLSTGPHLDFRFYRNGAAIDPLKVKSPAAKPVHSKNLVDFIKLRNQWMKELDTITLR